MIEIYTLQAPSERYAEQSEWNSQVWLLNKMSKLVCMGLMPEEEYWTVARYLEDYTVGYLRDIVLRYCDQETYDTL